MNKARLTYRLLKYSSCNLVIDRDINGARNIFIKCIDEML